MSTKNIEQRILETTQAEVDGLIAKAKDKAKARLDAAAVEQKRRAEQAIADAQDTERQQYDQQVTSAKAANKLKLLTRRAELLDTVLDGAVARFVADTDGAYAGWLAQQLNATADRTGTILAAPNDREPLAKLLAELKQSGKGAGLTLAEESHPLRGGFVLRGEDIDLDFSLDTQLAELKTQLLPQLAEKAFGPSGAQKNT